MKYFNVTFRWYNSSIFCANIAHADSAEAVHDYYAKEYGPDVYVSECGPFDVQNARERGKPIVEIA